jgi:hypothetical protein
MQKRRKKMDPVILIALFVFVGFPLGVLVLAWLWPVE